MDYFNLYDPLLVVLYSLSAVVCLTLIFELGRYLRGIVPKSVECWFCRYKTEVNYSNRNSWTCPNCEQYNGFTQDGDYNKVIASQHNESLNLLTVAQQIPKNELKKSIRLCNKCNLKQELKVKQLASFVPMREKNFDTEIEHFREQIEKNYELCDNCEKLITKVLQNLREELSLPKKLYSAISQLKIKGERAIYINILLSSVLAVSSLEGKVLLPTEVNAYVNVIRKELYFLNNYAFLMKILNHWIQLVIATGFLVNSIGYFQTKSAGVFLNSCSWILMFFLTLYPAQYEEYVRVLKVISGIISVVISLVIILKNYRQKSKKKQTFWERKYSQFSTPSGVFQRSTTSPNISRSSSSDLSASSFKYSPKVARQSQNEEFLNTKINNSFSCNPKTKHTPADEVQSYINFGLSNLNLGQRHRKDARQRNPKPLLTPPKFNPFSGTRSYMSSNKSCLWKPTNSFSYNQYEPSVTPSVYDVYEPPEPSVATITSFGCPQPCYPSCPPTLAYYFSAQNFPKPPIIHASTPVSDDQDKKNRDKWTIMYSLPVIFLIGCNIFLLCILYNKETPSPQT